MNHSDAFSVFSEAQSLDKVDIQSHVAEWEQRQVRRCKAIMIIVLFFVAVGLTLATFMIIKTGEDHDFENLFDSQAHEIVGVSGENIKSSLLAIETFATSISSYAKGAGMAWPYVTVGDYTGKALQAIDRAGVGDLIMAPFVQLEERYEFEEYVREHIHEQLQDTYDFLGQDRNASELQDLADVVSYLSWSPEQHALIRQEEPYNGTDLESEYLVYWQNTVVYPGFVLDNLMRNHELAPTASHAREDKKARISFRATDMGFSTQVFQPIFQDVLPDSEAEKREVVAMLWFPAEGRKFFENIMSPGSPGPRIVLEGSCGYTETYEMNGLESEFVGIGMFVDPNYEHMELSSVFFDAGDGSNNLPEGECVDHITMRIFPTEAMKESVTTYRPVVYSVAVLVVFVFTSFIFLGYDYAVRYRQTKVMKRINAQDKVVANMFPEAIRKRLYESDALEGTRDPMMSKLKGTGETGRGKAPIADLFLETTVLFADIAGFTAWSSAREPSQVFILLENIYGAFDKVSHRYGVFKVETVGDCYVAVTGLPDPRKDHALCMAKFARACLTTMSSVTAKMEIDLGPETGDLNLRIGLHSGQVTAGVLRGDRCRFQLFGDTVNVASRIEGMGDPGKIHLSAATAKFLEAAGYSRWIRSRGMIDIRGKGHMETYWLLTSEEAEVEKSIPTGSSSEQLRRHVQSNQNEDDEDALDDTEASSNEYDECVQMSKEERMVEWNVEILCSHLRRILAARCKSPKSLESAEESLIQRDTVLEEFEEIIKLPRVTVDELKGRRDYNDIKLSPDVVESVRQYVTEVAKMYRGNAFHSFEHASHVMASVAKLLSRIVRSDTTKQTQGPSDLEESDMAAHSYGITNDPLTQFAVIFTAIIHDVDHQGVPNAQLVREESPMVVRYKGKSLAEQNSVDLAWSALMKPEYKAFRACIYADTKELKRFRQLVVNMVMATDIADKELGALRKARWNQAFDVTDEKVRDDFAMNRKATIVLEHLIQASDVSHTMQHWHIYTKWNQKFFDECYGAWKAGRAEKDPSIGWYEGEIGFFNFYVIPLAKKLDSCGVFGVSSHEYLNYATANLDEWKRNGQSLVQDFVRSYNQ